MEPINADSENSEATTRQLLDELIQIINDQEQDEEQQWQKQPYDDDFQEQQFDDEDEDEDEDDIGAKTNRDSVPTLEVQESVSEVAKAKETKSNAKSKSQKEEDVQPTKPKMPKPILKTPRFPREKPPVVAPQPPPPAPSSQLQKYQQSNAMSKYDQWKAEQRARNDPANRPNYSGDGGKPPQAPPRNKFKVFSEKLAWVSGPRLNTRENIKFKSSMKIVDPKPHILPPSINPNTNEAPNKTRSLSEEQRRADRINNKPNINPEMVKWRSQVQEKLNALHNNATKTKNTTINSNRSREGVNGGEDADILDLDGEKDGVSNDTAPKKTPRKKILNGFNSTDQPTGVAGNRRQPRREEESEFIRSRKTLSKYKALPPIKSDPNGPIAAVANENGEAQHSPPRQRRQAPEKAWNLSTKGGNSTNRYINQNVVDSVRKRFEWDQELKRRSLEQLASNPPVVALTDSTNDTNADATADTNGAFESLPFESRPMPIFEDNDESASRVASARQGVGEDHDDQEQQLTDDQKPQAYESARAYEGQNGYEDADGYYDPQTIQRQTYLNQNANDYDQQETEQVDDFGGNIQQEQRDDYDLDYEQQQLQQQQQPQEQDNGELNDAAPISYGKTQIGTQL